MFWHCWNHLLGNPILRSLGATHGTASIFINDNEDGLIHDFTEWLEEFAPHLPLAQYQHNLTGKDNADAHLKRTIMGREPVVAVYQRQIGFRSMEQIFYGEFDGQRPKQVLVKIIGE